MHYLSISSRCDNKIVAWPYAYKVAVYLYNFTYNDVIRGN